MLREACHFVGVVLHALEKTSECVHSILIFTPDAYGIIYEIFSFIQFKVSFKIISLMTSQSVGGAKREHPRKTI